MSTIINAGYTDLLLRCSEEADKFNTQVMTCITGIVIDLYISLLFKME